MTAEMFATKVRYSGAATASQLGLVVTGFAPAIAAAIVRPGPTGWIPVAAFTAALLPRLGCRDRHLGQGDLQGTHRGPWNQGKRNQGTRQRLNFTRARREWQGTRPGPSLHLRPNHSEEPSVTARHVLIEQDVETPLRDGIVLRSTVYRPRTGSRARSADQDTRTAATCP